MDAENNDWITLWPYVVLLLILSAGAVHLLLAPSHWLEWVGAGSLQAFIVAFCAEMNGIVLTNVPFNHGRGHPWAALLGYGTSGAVFEMMLGSVLVVVGLLLIVKGWIKLYFHSGRLITDGAYAMMRHPQYAGIFLVVFGTLMHWPTIPVLLLAPVILWLYVRLAKREEADLIDRFGTPYKQYQELVPMFVPGW
ncbi:isoprenylcysteine carboxyl methyltransferase [Phyllobacterium brassicacearum]|uniref:Isoprenylcysteine carboxyl methyltransferase n=1 Tax=Phyllobacterium brassicacearum TaxID=314235 RepID=A0A2P7B978_9HYPH|nr:isoprenylcysteine carboxylmethyltransferase family protein [Phyllobacterium brassicacearum]PSH62972.1 isoprenylcysteine carboxyl methyltransferase [Phyllobacterium brassicacearum]